MGKCIKAIPLVVILSFCFISCSKKADKFFISNTFPDQIIKNLSIDKYDLEKHEWNFFAIHGDVYEKKKVVNATNIRMSFYENKKISSFILAVLQSDTGDVKAMGNVSIVSLLKNTTIYADSLNYFGKTNRVTSNSFIRQEKQDSTITGIGLEANSDLSDITILKDVKVVKK